MKTLRTTTIQTLPPELQDVRVIRKLFLALVIMAMLLGQLFSFEDFPAVIAEFGFPGGQAADVVMAIVVVALEYLSLPYLLSVKTRASLLRISKYAALSVPLLWLFCLSWLFGFTGATTNTGLLGDTLPVIDNVVVMLMMVIFATLMIYTVYGPTIRQMLERTAKR